MSTTRAYRLIFSSFFLFVLWVVISIVYLLHENIFTGGWQETFKQTHLILNNVAIKPMHLIRSAGHIFLVLGSSMGLTAVFYTAGATAIPYICGRWQPDSTFAGTTSILFGYAVIGSAYLGLGLCGLFYPCMIIALLLLPSIGRLFMREHAFSLNMPDLSGVLDKKNLIFIPSIFTFLMMCVPDFRVDTLIYHLSAPELFLRLHKIAFDNVAVMFHYPLATELLYSSALIAGMDEVSHFIDFIPYAAAIILLIIEVRRAAGNLAAWLTGVLCFTHATVLQDMTLSKNGLSSAAYPVAGAICIIRAYSTGSGRVAAIGALLTGCGGTIKATGLVTMVTTWVFAEILLRGKKWWTPKYRLACMAATIAPSLPWMSKSWLSMGDPVWPLLSNILPSALWDHESSLALGAERSKADLLQMLSSSPVAFIRNWMLQQPLIIWILPFSIKGMLKMPRQWKLASLISLLTYAIYYYLFPASSYRFALPSLILFGSTVFVGFAAMNAGYLSKSVVFFSFLSSWLSIGSMLAYYGAYDVNAIGHIFGNTNRKEYFEKVLTAYADIGERLEQLNIRGNVIIIGETRTYRLPVRSLACRLSGRNQAWLLAKTCGSPEQVLIRLRQINGRYILYNFIAETYPKSINTYYTWDNRMLVLWENFAEKYLEAKEQSPTVNTFAGGFCLLKIRSAPSQQQYVKYLPGLESLYYKVSSVPATRDNKRWLEEAQKLYSRFPRVGNVASLYAYCLRTLGRYREAYSLYRILIKNDVLGEDTWVGAAICAAEINKYDEAIRYAERALLIYPEWLEQTNMVIAKASNNLADRLLARDSDIKRALILSKRAVSLVPNRAAFWDTLAECQIKNGLKEEALASYRMALEKDTDKSHNNIILSNMKKAGFSTTSY